MRGPTIRTLRGIATSLAAAGLLGACSGGSSALGPPNVSGVPLGPTTQSAAGTSATQSAAAIAKATSNSQRQDITVRPLA